MFTITAPGGDSAPDSESATPAYRLWGPDSVSAFAIALSHDGKTLATSHEDRRVRLRDPATGVVRRTIEGHTGPVHALAFRGPRRGDGPDASPATPAARHRARGPLLASGSADQSVRLWDPGTGRSLGVLRGHWDKVYAVAFSPDGATLATGSNDTTIRIWDVATGDEMTQLRGHDAYVYSLAFSPDGRMLVSGSGDGTVRVWDTRPVRERWRARTTGDRGP
jgi:WD40 repeat protein